MTLLWKIRRRRAIEWLGAVLAWAAQVWVSGRVERIDSFRGVLWIIAGAAAMMLATKAAWGHDAEMEVARQRERIGVAAELYERE